WLHDWWYDSGFTEATGNAQQDNFGRGGVAGDPMQISAQAGANRGLRNNADMGTPADGARPRMRMFLWTARLTTSATTAAGTFNSSSAFNAGPHKFDITGDVVAVTDTSAPTDDGCQAYATPVTGKIVVATFSGVCGSLMTVNNAKAAGAVGIVLIDPANDA